MARRGGGGRKGGLLEVGLLDGRDSMGEVFWRTGERGGRGVSVGEGLAEDEKLLSW